MKGDSTMSPGFVHSSDAAADHFELQRADVALVVVLAGAAVLQRVGRVDVHPHRAGDLLPLVDGVVVVRDALGLLARRAHRDEVVRDALRHMAAFSRTLLCSRPRALVRCIAVTGSFQIVTFAGR
jgi:hypothetical protein